MKKIYNILFVAAFFVVLVLPLVLTDFRSGGISEDENRMLATFPPIIEGNRFNEDFTTDFENWYRDHMGLRREMINLNASIQFSVFDRMLENSDYHIGPYGDINYATEDMIKDYAHVNLRSDYYVQLYGDSYQTTADWLEEQGIAFFYVQCYDKHSIYPEQFTRAVKQIGDVSKTDQIIGYLENQTKVNTISLKKPLLEAKGQYEVYSNWGDPSHWSERGAFVGYQYIMEQLQKGLGCELKVLQEQDYVITVEECGITLNEVIHQDDMLEVFALRDPKARKTDNSVMAQWKDDYHTVWKNPEAGNDLKVLLLCDSYFNSYIVDDLAESFSETWVIWADHMMELPEMIELYQPDVVIVENAERVDRSYHMWKLAEKIVALQTPATEQG